MENTLFILLTCCLIGNAFGVEDLQIGEKFAKRHVLEILTSPPRPPMGFLDAYDAVRNTSAANANRRANVIAALRAKVTRDRKYKY